MLEMEFPPFEACIVRSAEDGVVVAVRGELDAATAPKLEAVLDVALSTTCRLILDLRNLTFMGSKGVAVLVAAQQHLGQIKESITLYKPSPPVVRVLEITGMDSCFDIRQDGLLEDSHVRPTAQNGAKPIASRERSGRIDIRMDYLRDFGSPRSWSLSR